MNSGSHAQGVVPLLEELIAIPSVNPDGNPGTDQVGEGRIAQFVGDFLKCECGASVEFQEIEPGRPNVLGIFPSENAVMKKKLLFAPHTDTVSVEGMSIAPFEPILSEGRVSGRGACDTKGSMAAMLWALRSLREEIPTLPWQIGFVGLMGEEAGLQGSRAFVESDTSWDFVVVGEPTECQVVASHKGALWVEIEMEGRAAHASQPKKGKNAILALAELILQMVRASEPWFAQFADPVLGVPTMSVGVIAGGSKVNIIPDSARARIDIRTTPQLTSGQIVAWLQEQLANFSSQGVCRVLGQADPLQTEEKHPLIEVLREQGCALHGAPWFCDAAVFSEGGMPAIALGPGSIDQAHTSDEWIAIDELEKGVEIYRNFLLNLS